MRAADCPGRWNVIGYVLPVIVRYVALEPVRQLTAPSLAYETGMARLRAAAATEHGPVIDTLDLLVLRSASETGER